MFLWGAHQPIVEAWNIFIAQKSEVSHPVIAMEILPVFTLNSFVVLRQCDQ
jgi:hypothetical protein